MYSLLEKEYMTKGMAAYFTNLPNLLNLNCYKCTLRERFCLVQFGIIIFEMLLCTYGLRNLNNET